MTMRRFWITGALIAALATFAAAQAPLTGPIVGAIGAPAQFVSAQNAGTDTVCAVGKDSTLFIDGTLKTVTVTPGTDTSLPASGTWTTTGGAGTGASGTFTATAGNLATVTIVLAGSGYTSNPTFVPNSGSIGTSTTAFSGCKNAANATAETAFQTTITLPAGTLGNTTIPVNLLFGWISSASAATITNFNFRLGATAGTGGTAVYTSGSGYIPNNALTFATGPLSCRITAAGPAAASTPVLASCGYTNSGPTGVFRNSLGSIGSLPVPVNATGNLVLTVTATYAAATAGNAMTLFSVAP